jgi:four helix bundle protein
MSFKDLKVWQKAYDLSLRICRAVRKFPQTERFGLGIQLSRAAISVPANIAEGYERQHRKEYLQFLSIARGSLGEVETYIMLAKDLGYFSPDEYESLEGIRAETGKLLRGLMKSLS